MSHPGSPGLGDPQPCASVHISHKEVRNSEEETWRRQNSDMVKL